MAGVAGAASTRGGERPGERRGSTRTAVVWDGLRPLLDGGLDGGPRRVLDIGGGTGGFAVKVAELGHRVTVVDPSPDALAALARRAREVGVEVAGVQGDLADLAALPGITDAPGPDVVLCHGVLEVVDDAAAALATIREVLPAGGSLSLLVAQRHAAVVARAMAGHFPQALALLEGHDAGRAGHRFAAEEATGLLTAAGFEVTAVHGIRVFADLVPGSLLELEPGAAAALVELERAVAERPEYLPLAAQLHLLGR